MLRYGRATGILAASGIAAVAAGLVIVIFWAKPAKPPLDGFTSDHSADERAVIGHTPEAGASGPVDTSGSDLNSARNLPGSERAWNGAVKSVEFGGMDNHPWVYADEDERREARQLKHRQSQVSGVTGGPRVLRNPTVHASDGSAPEARGVGPQGSSGIPVPSDLPGPGQDLNPSTGLPRPPSEDMQKLPGPEFGSGEVPSSGPARPHEEIDR